MLDSDQALDWYFNHYLKRQLDVNYGIRDEDGQLMMGDQPVKVEYGKIIVRDNVYPATSDLWALWKKIQI